MVGWLNLLSLFCLVYVERAVRELRVEKLHVGVLGGNECKDSMNIFFDFLLNNSSFESLLCKSLSSEVALYL